MWFLFGYGSILDRLKLRLAIGTVFLLFASGWACFTELRYLAFAKRTDAKFVEAMVTHSGEVRSVTYEFTDPGMAGQQAEDRFGRMAEIGLTRRESDSVPDWWALESDTIAVDYLPGSASSSRLAGHRNLWLCAPFLACLAVGAVLLSRFWVEYRDYERRKANW